MLRVATLSVAFTLSSLCPVQGGSPNVLFILSDDLSYTDLSCYGNEWFETPHLDKLAATGMRFTQAYSPAPICSASRTGILTGKTPARLGFEFVTKNEPGFQPMVTPLRAPPFSLNLALEETTIPEALSKTGRPTAFFGKWHVNQHYERYLGWSPTHGPLSQGFETAEEDFGSHPYSYWSQKKERNFTPLKDGTFVTDTLTKRAIKFIKAPHEKAFFCMVSHFYVHDPIHTRAEWLYEHYLEKIPDTHPRQEKLAHYGAMVTTLDHHVGELIDALDESGKRESTLIVFTSDNGGHPNYAGNAPLRGSKWNLYEGGIRVPFIANWKSSISRNSICDVPITSLDLFPTFAQYAEVDASTAKDGKSLLPLFYSQRNALDDRALFWHFPYYHPEKGYAEAPSEIGSNDGYTSQTKPHSAIRRGDWKLLYFYEDKRTELYHLKRDPYEKSNLAESNPEKASDLLTELQTYLKDSDARMPIPHPDYDTAK